jgi:hypothetical protein
MVNDMMRKEGWTRSYALSVLRSKFESEERQQEISYIDDLIRKEAEEQEEEQGLVPTTTTTNTVEEEEELTTTKEPPATTTTTSGKPSKVTHSTQQKGLQETISSKSLSKELDKQTIQINKKITQIFQPLQKYIKSVDKKSVDKKSVDKQSQLIKQLQSQLSQLQKQVSQIQRAVGVGKKKEKR